MVRRLLLSTAAAAAMAGSAYAADVPDRRPPPVAYVPSVPIFTGFYVGVNAGGAFRGSSNDGFNDAVFFDGAAPFALGNTRVRTHKSVGTNVMA